MPRDNGSTRKKTLSLGFLTVVEDGANALFGGYLLLNRLGRPLEFHCTAPIIPNRAQEILYGPTLRPFLFGEQIGKTLVERAKKKPSLLCIDRQECFAVREHTPAPTVLVQSAMDDRPEEDFAGSEPSRRTVGVNRLVLSPEDASVEEDVWTELFEAVEDFDLAEPFFRIRDAIEEARRGRRAA